MILAVDPRTPDPLVFIGTVKRWIPRLDPYPYGFLVTEEGEEYYFNQTFAMVPIVERNEIRWAYPDEVYDNVFQFPTPKEGDIIYFKLWWSHKQHRDVVEAWTFKSMHDELQTQLDTRPVYRLMSQNPYTRVGVANPPRIAWEGQEPSLASLVSMSPEDQQTHGYHQWWLLKEGDQWVKCDDPRPNPIYLYRPPLHRV